MKIKRKKEKQKKNHLKHATSAGVKLVLKVALLLKYTVTIFNNYILVFEI
jgi:hypothetical protein